MEHCRQIADATSELLEQLEHCEDVPDSASACLKEIDATRRAIQQLQHSMQTTQLAYVETNLDESSPETADRQLLAEPSATATQSSSAMGTQAPSAMGTQSPAKGTQSPATGTQSASSMGARSASAMGAQPGPSMGVQGTQPSAVSGGQEEVVGGTQGVRMHRTPSGRLAMPIDAVHHIKALGENLRKLMLFIKEHAESEHPDDTLQPSPERAVALSDEMHV